ncbi:MAG: CARDB domain-containing protein, partial [Anaerolineae bacterium]|nr:CARDB domain-containing protein [Anaerolineae bacterium]
MPHGKRTFSVRVVLVPLMLALAALACNLTPSEPQATATAPVLSPTTVALSDVPEVEILAPADGSEVVVQTAVQVSVRATDRIGVTRIEMRANGLIVDAIAAPDPAGVSPLESLLSWTPVTLGQNIIEVTAFRGNTRGNPKRITLIVRQTQQQVTRPAFTAPPPNRTPTVDLICRARVNVNGLNLRTGPGTNYPSIGNLALGAELPVIGTNFERSWFQVVAAERIGWVSGSFVTLLGVCNTVSVVQIPPSPTVLPGTPIVILPTFTPLPTLFFPTPTTTIPVIVLPTLTPSPFVPPTQGPITIGQLTSTAIFATQTALAFSPTPPPSPTPSLTPPPGVTLPTATPSATPTATATPLLPDLIVSRVEADRTTVILDPISRSGQLVVMVTVRNQGAATAPVFQVSVRQPNGVTVTQPTVNALAPGQEEMLRFEIVFSLEGSQQLTIIADSGNVVTEFEETNNVAFLEIIGVVATVPGATATPSPTITLTPTETPTPIPTATFTPEPLPPTETPTLVIILPPTATPEPVVPTATPTTE